MHALPGRYEMRCLFVLAIINVSAGLGDQVTASGLGSNEQASASGTEQTKAVSLEDDFRALNGTWTKHLFMQLSVTRDKFPNLRVTLFRLEEAKDNSKADEVATPIYEGKATVQEKDGRRFLL